MTSQLALFQAAVIQSWNAIVITAADRAAGYPVQIANPAFCTMTGYTMDELRGRSLKLLQGPETDAEVIDRLRACLREGRFFEGTAINYRKDGTRYVVQWNITPIRDEEGVLTHFVSVQQDISDRVRAQRETRLLARALDAASDPILVTDTQKRIVFANTAFAEVSGYPVSEIVGRTPALFRSGKQGDAFYAQLQASLENGRDFRATFVNKRRDGSLYHAEQSISPITDELGRITHYVCVGKDISERVVMEKALRVAATQDALTGLYNRGYGEHLLDEAVHRRTAERPFSVVVCDIDHFKSVNDRFGHPAGDRVIENVAHILRQSIRSSDAAIRWGGEEFVILLDDCPMEVALMLAERIRARVQDHVDEEVGKITASLGLAMHAHGESASQVFERADAALYEAKRGGRNRVVVAPSR